jgi:hypothetical protein
MKALLRLVTGLDGRSEISTSDRMFDRVRAEARTYSDKPDPSAEG